MAAPTFPLLIEKEHDGATATLSVPASFADPQRWQRLQAFLAQQKWAPTGPPAPAVATTAGAAQEAMHLAELLFMRDVLGPLRLRPGPVPEKDAAKMLEVGVDKLHRRSQALFGMPWAEFSRLSAAAAPASAPGGAVADPLAPAVPALGEPAPASAAAPPTAAAPPRALTPPAVPRGRALPAASEQASGQEEAAEEGMEVEEGEEAGMGFGVQQWQLLAQVAESMAAEQEGWGAAEEEGLCTEPMAAEEEQEVEQKGSLAAMQLGNLPARYADAAEDDCLPPRRQRGTDLASQLAFDYDIHIPPPPPTFHIPQLPPTWALPTWRRFS